MTGVLDNEKIIRRVVCVIAGALTGFLCFAVLGITGMCSLSVASLIGTTVSLVFLVTASTLLGESDSRRAGQLVLSRIFLLLPELFSFFYLAFTVKVNVVFAKLLITLLCCIGSELIADKLYAREKKGFATAFKENYAVYIPMLVVFTVLTVIYIAELIYPLAWHSLTIIDSVHQYLPFFSDYRDKLLNERSLNYTWNVALGSNYMSLSSYYLASPFNILFIFFPKSAIPAVASILYVVKLSLCAGTMGYFLTHKSGRNVQNPLAIGLSLCYAFSNYMVGYYWNTMWLDCLLLFPLIMLGFERLCRDKDVRLYSATLALSLYCNYYIGFSTCVFLVLWFLAYHHGGVKKFFGNGVRFAFASLLAGGIAAFMLLPAYHGIMATAAGVDITGSKSFLPEHEWYGSIFVILRQLLFLTKPITNQIDDGGANMYCGMACLFAVFLYIFYKKDGIFTRLKRGILVAFLVVSTNEVILNYIWHGFHNQYGIPNRFTYLLAFIMILTAYDVLRSAKKLHPAAVVIASAGTFAFIIVLFIMEKAKVSQLILYSSLALAALYMAFVLLRSLKVFKKKAYIIAMTAVISVELIVSGVYGFADNGYATLGSAYTTLPKMTEAKKMMERHAEEDEAVFYRAEVMDYDILDESTLYNLPSVGTFNSTVLGSVVTTMGRLGFYTGANEFLYRGATPFTNSILGVRYLFKRKGDFNNFGFTLIDEEDGVKLYENPYPLSVGFAVNEIAKEFSRNGSTPIRKQQELCSMMTGKQDFYTVIYPEGEYYSEDMEVSGSLFDPTVRRKESGTVSFRTDFTAPEDGDYYINCRGNNITEIEFYVNDDSLTKARYQIQIFHIGELKKGDIFSAELIYKNPPDEDDLAHFQVALFDREAYEKNYHALRSNQLKVTEFEDGLIEGNVNMPEGKTLFTSVPYDEGWKVYVDENEVEYYAFAESFIGIDVPEGLHHVKMVYVPTGLKLGWIITGVSALIFILCCVMYKKREEAAGVITGEAKDFEEAEEEPGVITGEAKEVEEAEEESGVITGEAKELNESEEEHE
ncbi:MAG: YfhO family protein [Lachnospiraceae bacterium]|nr:YfhO family protein [Lachnospiraceae bacterium]